MPKPENADILVLGAGAAGMFCAAQAAATGKKVTLIDHAKAAGEKIRISGGGRCNFTNKNVVPDRFISENRHFMKSALAGYSQHDFINLVQSYHISYHEKTLGQLFCDHSSRDIIHLLLDQMQQAQVKLSLQTHIIEVHKTENGFETQLEKDGKRWLIQSQAVVVATGGKAIPKMGATDFGLRLAQQFNLKIVPTRPALVPLTLGENSPLTDMAGIAVPSMACCNTTCFEEAVLFTHRGLSGPAILQISSYWREGDSICLNLIPHQDLYSQLRQQRASQGRKTVATLLAPFMPKRLAQYLSQTYFSNSTLAQCSDKQLLAFTEKLKKYAIKPTGTEGYRKAEVMRGGVSTAALNSKTMEAKQVPGLYFIGEVVDVTGWLGGYNFQWAWSSAWSAGQALQAVS